MRASQKAALLVALAILIPGAVTAQEIIPPGFDAFITHETTCVDFTDSPIPAGFFGPGSDPFGGTVCFGGEPLGPDPSCPAGWDNADTIIERLGPAEFPFIGASDTVPIEIVALSLQSANPIAEIEVELCRCRGV